MTASPDAIPIIPAIAQLAQGYDAWLCDVWGVMHNGVRAFPGAVDACRRFRERGGTVLLVSNAPRPASAVARQIGGLGVPEDAYDAILTSGDLTRSLISKRPDQRLFHLGPARDKPLFDGLDLQFAAAEEAEVIICSGLYNDDVETPSDYTSLLEAVARRRVPMICANPDLTVERGSRIVYCAGALAAEYERLGGQVTYAGKPYRPIYERAFEMIADLRKGPVPLDRILAIGDGLKTDIRGAADAGIASIFVASAVHVPGEFDAAAVTRLFSGTDCRPIAAVPALVW